MKTWKQLEKPFVGLHWWYHILTGTRYSFPYLSQSKVKYDEKYYVGEIVGVDKQKKLIYGNWKACSGNEYWLKSNQYPYLYKMERTNWIELRPPYWKKKCGRDYSLVGKKYRTYSDYEDSLEVECTILNIIFYIKNFINRIVDNFRYYIKEHGNRSKNIR